MKSQEKYRSYRRKRMCQKRMHIHGFRIRSPYPIIGCISPFNHKVPHGKHVTFFSS
uniref:Putative F-box protein PP2-B12 n=1 Tax=Rhizophora mucronata TaxID=61149 RepID=A0A2P2K0N7_RHIMU